MITYTRHVLKHPRGAIFASILAANRLNFAMETLAIVHGGSDREARERAEFVRRSFAAAGKGYLPGEEHALPRVA